jgi:hypothetical protein
VLAMYFLFATHRTILVLNPWTRLNRIQQSCGHFRICDSYWQHSFGKTADSQSLHRRFRTLVSHYRTRHFRAQPGVSRAWAQFFNRGFSGAVIAIQLPRWFGYPLHRHNIFAAPGEIQTARARPTQIKSSKISISNHPDIP